MSMSNKEKKKIPKAALPALTEAPTDGKIVEPPEPPEEGLWFDLGRDNHQKTPAGRILLAFKFIDNNPKPREPRKTVDKGRGATATTGSPTPPSQPKIVTTIPTTPVEKKDEKVSSPKPPASPKPGDKKEEKKKKKLKRALN